jgi:hypothetical protein
MESLAAKVAVVATMIINPASGVIGSEKRNLRSKPSIWDSVGNWPPLFSLLRATGATGFEVRKTNVRKPTRNQGLRTAIWRIRFVQFYL